MMTAVIAMEIKATAAKTVLIRRNWTDQHHHLSFHQIKTAMNKTCSVTLGSLIMFHKMCTETSIKDASPNKVDMNKCVISYIDSNIAVREYDFGRSCPVHTKKTRKAKTERERKKCIFKFSKNQKRNTKTEEREREREADRKCEMAKGMME